MKITKLLSAALLASTVAGSAMAADLPSRRAPPVLVAPPVFTWTGVYLGVTGGYAWGTSSYFTDSFSASGLGDPTSYALAASGRSKGNSFTGGGTIGFNYQVNSIVMGLEGDISYLNTRKSSAGFGVNNAGLGIAVATRAGVGNAFGTIRGRIGYAFGPVLVYGTGGVAFANTTASQYSVYTNGIGYAGNSSVGKSGWVAGGGVEWAFAPNWSVKFEYLHAEFGKSNLTAISYNPVDGTSTFSAVSNKVDLARVGINYRFAWGSSAPVVARY